MSYFSAQALIVPEDGQVSRQFAQPFGGPAVASNAAVKDVTLPEQGGQTLDDANLLPNSENIDMNTLTLNIPSGNIGINPEFPESGSWNVNYQPSMHGNVSQTTDFQDNDAMDFEMMRYALEPDDFTSYMENYQFSDDTNAIGDADNPLSCPTPTHSNDPVAEGSGFGLESNGDDVQNNYNNEAVVGDNSQISVTNNTANLALTQTPANVPGPSGFVVLLPCYDPSTGQTSNVSFPISALQNIPGFQGMGQIHPNQLNSSQFSGLNVANGRLNASLQQPEIVQGNSQGDSIPMAQLVHNNNTNMNFGASEMSGNDSTPSLNIRPVNQDWSRPVPSSSSHIPPTIGFKRLPNENQTIDSRPRKRQYQRCQLKAPTYPHPHSLEERKLAPPYVKIGHKNAYFCNYIGPAEVNSTRICGQPLMTGVRNCKRHLAKHAEQEEKMIAAGVLKLEEAHALFWVEKIKVECRFCHHQELVWRTDGVRAKHEAESHPEIFANRRKVVRNSKGKEKA
ncbi:hypothetical protein Clacol_007997 [Clathrus columnatus]|uniref:Uncharacterized protein n=1 Tax=Clathrus columnatus TaxID=1419009 RepID=A0AAV5AGH6_9AGAM|nr:hypothetical protein Clacol_007997 [Clathrus columnatus]